VARIRSGYASGIFIGMACKIESLRLSYEKQYSDKKKSHSGFKVKRGGEFGPASGEIKHCLVILAIVTFVFVIFNDDVLALFMMAKGAIYFPAFCAAGHLEKRAFFFMTAKIFVTLFHGLPLNAGLS